MKAGEKSFNNGVYSRVVKFNYEFIIYFKMNNNNDIFNKINVKREEQTYLLS